MRHHFPTARAAIPAFTELMKKRYTCWRRRVKAGAPVFRGGNRNPRPMVNKVCLRNGVFAMKRRNTAILAALAATSLGLAACSEQTQEDGKAFAEGAAEDTAANAEVVGEKLEEATIVAADKVSDGAADLRDEVAEKRENAPENDGELDGTD